LDERESGGPFLSMEEFMKRVPKKLVRAPAREATWKLNGFEAIDCPPTEVECASLLGLKEVPINRTWLRTQTKYLGSVVPNKRRSDGLKWEVDECYTAELIRSLDLRGSMYGPYPQDRMHHRGLFWTRAAAHLDVGDVIGVIVNDANGKAADIVEFH